MNTVISGTRINPYLDPTKVYHKSSFPLSATAMAVTVMCGRVGAIVGNVIFGALVDQHCVVPIYMFGTLLICKLPFVYCFLRRSQ